MRIVTLEPTVFFVRDGAGLRQLARLQVEGGERLEGASLRVQGAGLDERLPLPVLGPGAAECELYLPDVREPVRLDVALEAGGTTLDRREVDWRPTRHWEVYLVHYSHHDLGYTDLPSRVLREHVGFLDDAVRFADRTQDWPDEARFRWLVEQAWSVDEYVARRSPEAVERLMAAVRRGQIEVTALFGNETSELLGSEELIRALYPAFKLRRQHGIRIVSAEHNDIPGFSWGLCNVLAGAGVRYFSPGIPRWYFGRAGRGQHRVHQLWDEDAVLKMDTPGAFWWEGIDGSRVLLWYDWHGGEWHPASEQQARRELPELLASLTAEGYPYDMVSLTLRGGHRDNAPAIEQFAYIVRAWNERWAYPQLVNSTNERFLAAFEDRWGHALKTLRGDVPGTDYPVGASGTARETAANRYAHDALLAGEKWATLASLVAGREYPRAQIDEAYRETLFYDEHAWGMCHPGGPAQDGGWAEKGAFALRAAALAHDLTQKTTNRIADCVALSGEGYHIIAHNPLSWARTDLVRAPLRPWQPCGMPLHWVERGEPGDGAVLASGWAEGRSTVEPPAALLEQPFELIDVSTGRAVPYQISRVDDAYAALPYAAERYGMGKVDPRHAVDLVFLAEGLPALGYRSYRVVPCRDWPDYALGGKADDRVLENRFFRLEMDPATGTVSSLYDKEQGRELLDGAAPHGFGQLIARWCETGEEELGKVAQASLSESGPLFSTLRVRGSVAGCPVWVQEITLHHTSKRVDVSLRLLRDATPLLELYLAFPFRAEAPRFRFEGPATVIEPLRDQLPGTNTDYYAVQHWAELRDGDACLAWAPIDAPMAEFGGLWPGYVSEAHHGVTPKGYGHPFLQPGELVRGHIYSLLMYNNFRTNFTTVHPGDVLLRYAIGAWQDGASSASAREFGWGAANAPYAVWLHGPQAGSLAPAESFCRVEPAHVMLLALKQAEDNNGVIVRLIETEGRAADVTLTVPRLRLAQAYATNLVEEDQRLLPCSEHTVTVPVRPYGMATVRLIAQS